MSTKHFNRRLFLKRTAVAAGGLALASSGGFAQQLSGIGSTTAGGKRMATDLVPLGSTGLKVSRLGIGLGSSNGNVQATGGQEKFNAFIKYAYDQGITMFDTAENYRTFSMMGPALKGLPREKIFIQSKISRPDNILSKIDSQRKAFDTDYVDSLLVHIQIREDWVETWKRAMDEFAEAQDKQWIKARGVSCHSLPALRASIATDWTQVHLVRVNPQGIRTDTEQQTMEARGANDIEPVLTELKKIGEKKRGMIGMKIFGGGQFREEAEREKSMRFAMSMPELDSVVIGFKSTGELDDGIKLMNRVLEQLV